MEIKSQLFETWLNEIKNNRIQELLKTKELAVKYDLALRTQRIYMIYGREPNPEWQPKGELYHVIPCMSSCCYWKTTKKIEIETIDLYSGPITLVQQFIEIDGKEYKDTLYVAGNRSWSSEVRKYLSNGFETYLNQNGTSITNANLVCDPHDKLWICKRAEKEIQRFKESLIAKVKKICGDTITEVAESSELYLTGSNGRVAKLWAIRAGGYNIQCLHTRVLCKEVKK